MQPPRQRTQQQRTIKAKAYGWKQGWRASGDRGQEGHRSGGAGQRVIAQPGARSDATTSCPLGEGGRRRGNSRGALGRAGQYKAHDTRRLVYGGGTQQLGNDELAR
ncbi:hypothetical protein NL676_012085 [Syzygium grande]|nr:hypothetical protein NL676_012085 [Syzygium grande]